MRSENEDEPSSLQDCAVLLSSSDVSGQKQTTMKIQRPDVDRQKQTTNVANCAGTPVFWSCSRNMKTHAPYFRCAKCSQLRKRASMRSRHEATCDANGAHLSALARTKLLQRFFSTTSGGDRRVNQTRPEDYLGDVGGR